ncbi:MAG: DnaD domain protein [Dehalococcoidales bacterium]|nr:DnaD domain protein [Dehalococcoidales bacterium]
MKRFDGFPPRMRYTPLPDVFFSRLLPDISDIAELKTSLYLVGLLLRKRGYPRFVTYQELLANKSLLDSLRERDKEPDEALRAALAMMVERGTILHLVLNRDTTREDAYFLNTASDRQAVAKIRSGELTLAGLKAGAQTPPDIETEPLPDIFTLYEQNVGMLTPMIAEELQEAEKLYPEAWIRDAIKEAVTHGKRKWSYIAAILERWSAEGRSDGAYRRDFEKTDPDKYIKGEYGHMVRR